MSSLLGRPNAKHASARFTLKLISLPSPQASARIHIWRARRRFGHRRPARSNAISKENGGVAPTGWDRFIVPRAQHLSDFQVNKLDPRAGQTRQIALAISEIPHTSTATRYAAARAAVK